MRIFYGKGLFKRGGSKKPVYHSLYTVLCIIDFFQINFYPTIKKLSIPFDVVPEKLHVHWNKHVFRLKRNHPFFQRYAFLFQQTSYKTLFILFLENRPVLSSLTPYYYINT